MRRLCSDRHKWFLNKGGSRSKAKGGSGGATTETPTINTAQSAPSLPEDVSLSGNSRQRIYTYQTPSGNELVFGVSDDKESGIGNVSFEVNGDMARGVQLDGRDGLRIASKVKSMMRYDASQRPDGYIYSTSAYVGDGLEGARASLYKRAGFSEASYPGEIQYAIVENGKMKPYTPWWMEE